MQDLFLFESPYLRRRFEDFCIDNIAYMEKRYSACEGIRIYDGVVQIFRNGGDASGGSEGESHHYFLCQTNAAPVYRLVDGPVLGNNERDVVLSAQKGGNRA